MLERLQALMARWREVKEVAALSDHDLADLGMTRDQVETFAQMPRDVPDRLVRMAAIFGLTEAELKRHHGEYLALVETCGRCGSRADCARMLGSCEKKGPEDCSFCPNAEAYARLIGATAH
jgi:hypothetical protein